MAKEQKTGLLDLEKELTCSICTEVLYQPLTLLDCLHTFCGSCLKSWFALQATRATSAHPYTCPSCRAKVRETRPNSTVTTLLDMFLQANPSKGKDEEEKRDIAKSYTPGENVLLTIAARRPTREDDEDRRLLEEVRDLSLREVQSEGHRRNGSYQARSSGPPANSRDPSRDSRVTRDGTRSSHESRRSGSNTLVPRPDRTAHSRGHSPAATSGSTPTSGTPTTVTARQIEHQSSLRSLMSASSVDSTEMEDEIMRQIVEEGLLDGIDLSNIDVSQEDEISERIADAYRARQRDRARTESARRSDSGGARPVLDQAQSSRRPRAQSRSQDSGSPPIDSAHLSPSSARAPVAYDRTERRSASSHSRRRTSSGNSSSMMLTSRDETRAAASRSATDLTGRPGSSEMTLTTPSRPRGSPRQGRRTTDPDPRVSASSAGPATSTTRRSVDGPRPANVTTQPRSITAPTLGSARPSGIISSSSRTTPQPSPGLQPPAEWSTRSSGVSSRPSSSSSAVSASRPRPRSVLYPEPSVSCDRCEKAHIEYALHYNCSKCKEGDFNICLSCYRQNKGCEHWYGFGYAAWAKYERLAPAEGYPANHPLPHTLTGHRYLRPKQPVLQPAPTDSNKRPLTTEDPSRRLQAGAFCSVDGVLANDCYWKCDSCNEGEWLYCNGCVNQGRCCTHPLLPLTRLASSSKSSLSPTGGSLDVPNTPTSSSAPSSPGLPPPTLPPTASILRGPDIIDHGPLIKPLTFSTLCSICHLPIQPSTTRFHCPQCNDGNHAVCTPCYLKLVSTSKIAPENGHQGWRRCLEGHRMVVVGFEDRDGGRKRIVVRNLVGGQALRVETQPVKIAGVADPAFQIWRWKQKGVAGRHSRVVAKDVAVAAPPDTSLGAAPFPPPDGGHGVRARALWGYFPAEGVTDELMFPRGAEITEGEDVNGDWFWGVFAGRKGLFPGGYVRVS